VCAGEFFQQFRCLSAGEFVRAIAKDFGEVAFRYDAVVLFRPRGLAPGFRNVLWSAAVTFPRFYRQPRVIKLLHHKNFVSRARSEGVGDGERYRTSLRAVCHRHAVD
jgi:hypothetical protein